MARVAEPPNDPSNVAILTTMKNLVLLLALGGTALIVLGSLVAIAAPGDGQTGMVTYPAWLLGGLAGMVALVVAFSSGETRALRAFAAGLAFLALLSVAGAFYASLPTNVGGKRLTARRRPRRS